MALQFYESIVSKKPKNLASVALSSIHLKEMLAGEAIALVILEKAL